MAPVRTTRPCMEQIPLSSLSSPGRCAPRPREDPDQLRVQCLAPALRLWRNTPSRLCDPGCRPSPDEHSGFGGMSFSNAVTLTPSGSLEAEHRSWCGASSPSSGTALDREICGDLSRAETRSVNLCVSFTFSAARARTPLRTAPPRACRSTQPTEGMLTALSACPQDAALGGGARVCVLDQPAHQNFVIRPGAARCQRIPLEHGSGAAAGHRERNHRMRRAR